MLVGREGHDRIALEVAAKELHIVRCWRPALGPATMLAAKQGRARGNALGDALQGVGGAITGIKELMLELECSIVATATL